MSYKQLFQFFHKYKEFQSIDLAKFSEQLNNLSHIDQNYINFYFPTKTTEWVTKQYLEFNNNVSNLSSLNYRDFIQRRKDFEIDSLPKSYFRNKNNDINKYEILIQLDDLITFIEIERRQWLLKFIENENLELKNQELILKNENLKLMKKKSKQQSKLFLDRLKKRAYTITKRKAKEHLEFKFGHLEIKHLKKLINLDLIELSLTRIKKKNIISLLSNYFIELEFHGLVDEWVFNNSREIVKSKNVLKKSINLNKIKIKKSIDCMGPEEIITLLQNFYLKIKMFRYKRLGWVNISQWCKENVKFKFNLQKIFNNENFKQKIQEFCVYYDVEIDTSENSEIFLPSVLAIEFILILTTEASHILFKNNDSFESRLHFIRKCENFKFYYYYLENL